MLNMVSFVHVLTLIVLSGQINTVLFVFSVSTDTRTHTTTQVDTKVDKKEERRLLEDMTWLQHLRL